MYMTGKACEEHNAYEGRAFEELRSRVSLRRRRCILQAKPAKNIMLAKAQPSKS